MNDEAIDLLGRMAGVYGFIRSYRDTGTVTSHSYEGDQCRTDVLRFHTRFVRPNRFLFHYWPDGNGPTPGGCAVWLEGGRTRAWWSIPVESHLEGSLGMALAGATGISRCSAHIVPRMLLPHEVGGWCLSELVEPQMGKDAPFEGHSCRVVEGRNRLGNPWILYLDARSYALRRVWDPKRSREPIKPDDSLLEVVRQVMPTEKFAEFAERQQNKRDLAHEWVIDYVPEMDPEIDEQDLIFHPPP